MGNTVRSCDRTPGNTAAADPSVRVTSNHLCRQEESILNPLDASDYTWQWGQFYDHYVGLTKPGGIE